MDDEEDVTARLLRLAGAPAEPGAERRARVRQAVHDAWRTERRQRIVRRNVALVAVCAVAAAVLVVVRVNRPQVVTEPGVGSVIATAARIEGRPLLLDGHGAVTRALTVGTEVLADDVVATDTTSRASLRTANGSSVRIDRNSRLRLLTPTAIELTGGAAYIDTARGLHGFEVRTPLGSVRDIGTQFEVRVGGSSLRLRVRTGLVQLRRGNTVTPVTAGTETTVNAGGLTVRELPPYDPEWAWTTALAPDYAIEGSSLAAFLEHTATEQGWTVRYASPDVAAVASRTILHGSVAGLRAEDALDATVVTSGLRYQLRAGELMISR